MPGICGFISGGQSVQKHQLDSDSADSAEPDFKEE
jgi:hypothetical protein